MDGLTISEVLAVSSEILEREGFGRTTVAFRDSVVPHRVFEDPYSIAAVFVFEQWQDVLDAWPTAQGLLVELLSEKLDPSLSKAWDGYLVLLTPAPIPVDDAAVAESIRYNTTRVRKLVGAGDDTADQASLTRVLLPLLPLEQRAPPTPAAAPILDSLPGLLARHGISPNDASTVVGAYRAQQNMLAALYNAAKDVSDT